ncbi:MAG: hypothetical protein ACFFAE_18680, partial [Candidatus Hodarchaeota archaeon]
MTKWFIPLPGPVVLLFIIIMFKPITCFTFGEFSTSQQVFKLKKGKIIPILDDLNSRWGITQTGEKNKKLLDENTGRNESQERNLMKSKIENPTERFLFKTVNGTEVPINRLEGDISVSENDIIITENTTWQNLNLIINYSIIVKSSAFQLINTTLTFNCTTNDWGIKIIENGELYLVNSSIGSINGLSLIITNSTTLINCTRSEIELLKGEDYSSIYFNNLNGTAILLRGNCSSKIDSSRIGYIKSLENVTVAIQKSTYLSEVNLLDFTTLYSKNSYLSDVNLFDTSSFNSTNDEITNLSKTATILTNESVTDQNITSFITQQVIISGSSIIKTKTNILLGRDQKVQLINLSASMHNIEWVFGDDVNVLEINNSTLPLKGIIRTRLNIEESNITIIGNSNIGHFNIQSSNCLIENVNLTLTGNITIYNKGNLIIVNSIFSLNSSYDGEYHIEVLNGAEMYVLSNSMISAYNKSYEYAFWINSGSKFRMENSRLKNCGYSFTPNIAGLWVNASKKFVFINNSIESDYFGLIIENVLNLSVENNSVTGGSIGIYAKNSKNMSR